LQEAVIPGLRFGQEYYNDLLATYTRKRDLFVEGLDAIGLTLQDEDKIAAYEASMPAWRVHALH